MKHGLSFLLTCAFVFQASCASIDQSNNILGASDFEASLCEGIWQNEIPEPPLPPNVVRFGPSQYFAQPKSMRQVFSAGQHSGLPRSMVICFKNKNNSSGNSRGEVQVARIALLGCGSMDFVGDLPRFASIQTDLPGNVMSGVEKTELIQGYFERARLWTSRTPGQPCDIRNTSVLITQRVVLGDTNMSYIYVVSVNEVSQWVVSHSPRYDRINLTVAPSD